MHTEPAIQSVVTGPSGLTVVWTDGQRSLFHYAWLRDCCYCEVCGDCFSSLRRYVPSLETLDATPRTVDYDREDLRIVWVDGDHASAYGSDWLYQNRYDETARRQRRPAYQAWDATTDIEDMAFDYDVLVSDDAHRLDMQRCLISHGLVVVRNGPAEDKGVLAFAELCGEVGLSAYGAVFDLKPGNAIGTAGTTLREVPPHSDEAFTYAPPGIEALACIRPAEDGGDSVMVDGFGVTEALRATHPEDYGLLASRNHHYVRVHAGDLDQRAHAPIIALDDDGCFSGIRFHTRASGPLDLPADIMEAYLEAYHRLCSMIMAPEHQMRLTLAAGDAVMFDNHRALHARSAFSDRARHMQICGVPREKFHESYRLLAARLGDRDGANIVLRAGACR